MSPHLLPDSWFWYFWRNTVAVPLSGYWGYSDCRILSGMVGVEPLRVMVQDGQGLLVMVRDGLRCSEIFGDSPRWSKIQACSILFHILFVQIYPYSHVDQLLRCIAMVMVISLHQHLVWSCYISSQQLSNNLIAYLNNITSCATMSRPVPYN